MKMKSIIIALLGVTLSSAAFGVEVEPNFYAGAEAQYNRVKNGKNFVDPANGKSMIRKQSPGGSLFVGGRLTENFGAEIGYAALGKSSKSFQNGSKLNVKMNNPYIDVLGFVPVAEEVDLIAAVGVGRLRTKTELTAADGTKLAITALPNVQERDDKTKTGIRLGVGGQYKFDRNFGARAMIRHQKGNKVIKNVNSAGLGLFYQF